ncbi:MAG TPA: PDR/VanB family oxidoreductase [Pseudonocardiaceae bacterium]|nr:PDR/VanB family oxidoreductase [Pseudonocardiaceae bacterium]
MDAHLVAPPDLRGRQRPDRLFRALGAFVSAYDWLTSGAYLRRPPTQRVDRDLHLVVDEVRVEAHGARSFRLAAAGGAELPRWQPGSHLDVLLPSGRRRQYSLCGDPADRTSYRIAVRRIADGAGGSRELHDVVGVGSALTVRGPRNAFPYVRAAGYLFLAGGIGITPILPMVKQAAAGAAPWQLVYTGRSRESMPFLDELTALDPARVWVRPYNQYGFPTSGAELLKYAPSGATVYCCGPAPMLASVRRDFPTSTAVALQFERFTAPPIVDGQPFEIVLQRGNRVLTVPADRSALDVIRQTVPDIAYSCQQGFCGTCRTRVISGEIDHRDRVLTNRERADTMTVCVSRSRGGRITVDL